MLNDEAREDDEYPGYPSDCGSFKKSKSRWIEFFCHAEGMLSHL